MSLKTSYIRMHSLVGSCLRGVCLLVSLCWLNMDLSCIMHDARGKSDDVLYWGFGGLWHVFPIYRNYWFIEAIFFCVFAVKNKWLLFSLSTNWFWERPSTLIQFKAIQTLKLSENKENVTILRFFIDQNGMQNANWSAWLHLVVTLVCMYYNCYLYPKKKVK